MHRLIKLITSSLAILIATSPAITAAPYASAPRLVVNIIIGSMQATDLERYSENLCEDGFRRFREEGITITNASYNHTGGDLATRLATFATGATPSIHGIVGERWYDFATSELKELTPNKEFKNIPRKKPKGGDAPHNLIAPTLSEKLRRREPQSITTSIALEPASAIALGGDGGNVMWFDSESCGWGSSTAYAERVEEWVSESRAYTTPLDGWRRLLDTTEYVNEREEVILRGKRSDKGWGERPSYEAFKYSYLGINETFELAYNAVLRLKMGEDDTPDLLNISLDSAQRIVERYGPDSVEAEDMYYRLDRELSGFMDRVRAKVKHRDVLFIVTSAGGSSPSSELASKKKRLNTLQFVAILNSFLNSKYGDGEWVLGYLNGAIYLNHQLIYSQKIDLGHIQEDAANFALQFQGVSHAITSSALRNSYFADGYAAMIQRGFYPSRSGDVLINLHPEWIEGREGCRSLGGSINHYDNHIPMLIWGSGVSPKKITRPLTICSLAATLAQIMKIDQPDSAQGEVIEEIVEYND